MEFYVHHRKHLCNPPMGNDVRWRGHSYLVKTIVANAWVRTSSINSFLAYNPFHNSSTREEGNGRHQFWFTTPPKVSPDVPYAFRLIVYEEIAWLMVNDHVLRTHEPLSVELGLEFWETSLMRPSKALDKDILWIFQPKKIGGGDLITSGDLYAASHKILT
ncbi:V-type proton ATPase catalytic subunit A [Artemisia annua]|uniref:V-type proton ATPase catalytic subunit A n=1 Tax=Artemisia annua TaxID=35608 RepID=A0A2U1L4B1_ARTAN|nr:V-type proton ATPase catalytic subunit A [Artemisia annua]